MACLSGLHVQYHHQSVSLAHGCGHTILQAGIVLVSHQQFVYHHLHIVILVSVQLHAGDGFHHLSVHPHVQVAFLTHLLEEFLVMSLAVAHQRSQQVDAFTLVFFQDKVQYLLLGVLHHLLAAQVGVGHARPGKEQTQVVIYLGRGAHGGTGILIGGLLLDGDDRAKAANLVYIRTLQVTQEVTRIG